MCARHVYRGVAVDERLRQHLADDPLAQAREEHQMLRAQQAQRVLQFGAVLVSEVGDHDEQRALAVRSQQALRRGELIGMRRRRLHVVQLSHRRG